MERKYFTGFHLKLIAIITMLIDHIGAAVLEPLMMTQYEQGKNIDTLSIIDNILRSIGRLAFPIFCFLLVEGFIHTRNRKKYMMQMAVFACLSEIPFDLAFFNQIFYLGDQNVFFTLLIGLCTMAGMEWVEEKTQRMTGGAGLVAKLAVACLGIVVAGLVHCDYSGIGIFLIVILYLFRNNRKKQCLYGAVSFLWEPTSLLSFIGMYFYNGQRGQKMNKYIFYAFYPVHLLLLSGIYMWIQSIIG